MASVTFAMIVIPFLPFFASFLGSGGTWRILALICGVAALLLSVQGTIAAVPWLAGWVFAGFAVRDRLSRNPQS